MNEKNKRRKIIRLTVGSVFTLVGLIFIGRAFEKPKQYTEEAEVKVKVLKKED